MLKVFYSVAFLIFIDIYHLISFYSPITYSYLFSFLANQNKAPKQQLMQNVVHPRPEIAYFNQVGQIYFRSKSFIFIISAISCALNAVVVFTQTIFRINLLKKQSLLETKKNIGPSRFKSKAWLYTKHNLHASATNIPVNICITSFKLLASLFKIYIMLQIWLHIRIQSIVFLVFVAMKRLRNCKKMLNHFRRWNPL